MSAHSIPTKSWTTPIPGLTKMQENYDTENFPFVDLMNVPSLGWVQKENQKSRNEFAKIAPRAKSLLKAMFVAGTVDRNKKLNAQQMYQELHKQVNKGELELEEIPKLSIVQNWITKTALVMKQKLTSEWSKRQET
ncbi:22175_t:CDS:2 [Gigaspora rosea]|nr:22175_t:CDS:2 [Gigaspora rosea]